MITITNVYNWEIYEGKKIFHGGVDLRSVDLKTGKLLPVCVFEESIVIRSGIDKYGNYFLVVKGLESNYPEIKYIHIDRYDFVKDLILKKNQSIGFSRIGGNSKSHHVHLETWPETVKKAVDDERFNPVNYFALLNLKYKIKQQGEV